MLPSVFIGSSSEGLPIANALANALRTHAQIHVWRDVFRIGDTFIESLVRELKRCDFAILVATADDVVESRGTSGVAPRDNVVFEAGLFIGAIGHHNAFLLCDSRARLKLPSDLAGITYATFDSSAANPAEAIAPAAQQIRLAIGAGGRSDVDFLRAYLTVIHPEVRISDTYAQILDGHLSALLIEAERLSQDEDWARLIALKQRLREYFEYSGRYVDGVRMGHAYVTALTNLGQPEEAAWARVKHVGYMYILAGSHAEGRRQLETALEASKCIIDPVSRARLTFYANRYLGVSYQRDPSGGNLTKARSYFNKASRSIVELESRGEQVGELQARILRNIANVLSQQRKYDEALRSYRRSLKLFLALGDAEHVGITQLSIAQTLIRSGTTGRQVTERLSAAEEAFSGIGWLEGLARVQEQHALHWRAIASGCKSLAEKDRAVQSAIQSARNARSLFVRIQLLRMVGSIDALLEQLGYHAPSTAA